MTKIAQNKPREDLSREFQLALLESLDFEHWVNGARKAVVADDGSVEFPQLTREAWVHAMFELAHGNPGPWNYLTYRWGRAHIGWAGKRGRPRSKTAGGERLKADAKNIGRNAVKLLAKREAVSAATIKRRIAKAAQ